MRSWFRLPSLFCCGRYLVLLSLLPGAMLFSNVFRDLAEVSLSKKGLIFLNN
jgi:hypothetical protein